LESIARKKYIQEPDKKKELAELEELDAYDPSNAEHIQNAYEIVKRIEALAEDADRKSVEKRLEAIQELKDIGLEKIRACDSGSQLDLKDFVDFHVHSSRSDGNYPPAYVVYRAWKAGMKAISVVDHNTFRHFEEAVKAGEILGIKVIPGVELNVSGKFDEGNLRLESMHIPVYFPYGEGIAGRENVTAFLEWLKQVKESELYQEAEKRRLWNNMEQEFLRQRFNKSDLAKKGGFEISLFDTFGKVPDHPNWSHPAEVLYEKYKDICFKGLNFNKIKKQYFDDNEHEQEKLRKSAEFWKKNIVTDHFSKDALKDLGNKFPHAFGIDIGRFISLVKEVHGIAVLAHPVENRNYWVKVGDYKKDTAGEKAKKLKEVFLAIAGEYPEVKDILWGVEVYSSKHSLEEMKHSDVLRRN
jgi:predicted metal-dependent phosphoesterase TrpH